jgi:phosphohistidine phosphatase
MAIFLVQHGKSLPKSEDPEQGLATEGRRDVRRIADTAMAYGVKVARIEHSGKARARQTAEILADRLAPYQGLAAVAGIKPLDDVVPLAQSLHSDSGRMLVGHLPFMERLCAYLITVKAEKPVFKFQNGGIVCLEDDPDKGGWVIKWALMPHVS